MLTVKDIETLARQFRALDIIKNDPDYDEYIKMFLEGIGKEKGLAILKLYEEFCKRRAASETK